MARRVALTVLVLYVSLLAVFWLGRHWNSPNLPREEIDAATLDLIDFTKLSPPVADFIDCARRNETVGQPMSAFPDLWSEALSTPSTSESERYQWWNFMLPMTAQQEMGNAKKVAAKEGALYWPMLMVRVDTRESRIVQVAIFTQGF